MKSELADASSSAYQALKKKIPDLDKYSIYSQIQLCLKGDCISKGNYWIPDFVLVREVVNPITKQKYLETIIVDAKLSGTSGWTKNQIAAKKMKKWSVKAIGENSLVKGDLMQNLKQSKVIYKKGDFIKLYTEQGVLKTK
jgi:hypothetical protein